MCSWLRQQRVAGKKTQIKKIKTYHAIGGLGAEECELWANRANDRENCSRASKQANGGSLLYMGGWDLVSYT